MKNTETMPVHPTFYIGPFGHNRTVPPLHAPLPPPATGDFLKKALIAAKSRNVQNYSHAVGLKIFYAYDYIR